MTRETLDAGRQQIVSVAYREPSGQIVCLACVEHGVPMDTDATRIERRECLDDDRCCMCGWRVAGPRQCEC